MPPPLPVARAPFPAAAIALGVAVPDRKAPPDREPMGRAPNSAPPATGARAATAARSRQEPHFESDPPLVASDDAPGGLVDPRAQDIAIMQSLIKGLADQLNAPTAPPLVRAATSHEARAPELSHAPPHTQPADDFDDAPAAAPPAASAPAHALDTVDGQVGALRNVASALRAPDAGLDEVDDPAHDHGYDRGLLAQIAGAVEAARIDIYLDPILGLDDRKARHFEVSVRLRNDDGELLDPRDFGQVMRGTGLGPRIEAHTFTESIQLAGQFAARGADASLFADLSAESLRDGGFHDALAGALTPDVALASRLVMSVAQSEVRSFGPAHWDALAAMAQTGLRYALVDVVDLDVDFEAIKRRGFDFVRLDAQVFLDGLPAPHGDVPAADLCRYLSRLGFAMIVGRIADERQLVKVLGFGALLGQGRLFGAPRPLRVEHVARQPSAA
jgi:cyclic-di-GMP phosphodiesterase TipF (flagellum assembly factor)